MQLSFPSVPSDSAAPAGLTATAAPEASAAAAAAPAAGFAQVLAGIAPSPTTPTAAAGTMLTALPADVVSAGFGIAAPEGTPVAAVPASPGQQTSPLVPGAGQVPVSGALPDAAPPVTPGARRVGAKDAVALADEQSLAVAAQWVMPLSPVTPLPTIDVPMDVDTGLDTATADLSSSAEANGLSAPLESRAGSRWWGFGQNAVSATPRRAETSFPDVSAALAEGSVTAAPVLPSGVAVPAGVMPAVAGQGGVAATPAAQTAAPSTPDASVAQPVLADAAAVTSAPVPQYPGRRDVLKSTGANFAVPTPSSGRVVEARSKVAAKSFVPTDVKELTQDAKTLGIGTAQPEATMPSGSTLVRPTSADTTVPPVAAAVSQSAHTDALPAPVALTSTAHRAVEAVLSTADRLASRDQHSVTMQFSVAGTDLNVRVAMRGGEVHTTFRTDNPELRAALSNEWQAVTSQQVDRPVRLAAPVFASTQDATASFSGDGASRQHQQQAQQQSSATAPTFAMRSLSRPAATASADAPMVATAARPVAANSLHLHTLA